MMMNFLLQSQNTEIQMEVASVEKSNTIIKYRV